MEALRQAYADGCGHEQAAQRLTAQFGIPFTARACYLKGRRMGIGPETPRARAQPGYRGVRGAGTPYRAPRQAMRAPGAADLTTTRGPTFHASGETATLESSPSPRITTLDQLLDAANVDLDAWEVERFVVNKWEVGGRGPDGTIVVEPLFQVKAWLRRSGPAVAIRRAGEAIVARVAALASGGAPAIVRRQAPDRGAPLFLCATYDLHIGKLAWGREVGENYDSRIAVARAEQAVSALIEDATLYRPSHVLYPFGQDLLHVDNRLGTTTSGTPQDADSRYEAMIDAAHAHTSWAIRRLAEAFGSVEAVLVTGNHARGTEFSLAKILEAEFRHDPRVTVDTAPKLRKYRRWGVTLLGLTHGDGGAVKKLPQLMPIEARDEWAHARYGEWIIGHTHTSRRTDATPVESVNGVVVRVLRSLSAPDAWHYAHGFVGEPSGAEGMIYDVQRGLRAQLTHYVDTEAAQRAAEARALAAHQSAAVQLHAA